MSSVPAKQFLRIKQVLIVSSAVALLAACSSDFQRLSSYPDVGGTTASIPQDTTQSSAVNSGSLAATPPSAVRPSWQNATRTNNRKHAQQPDQGTVVVQPGQTLYSIARANDMTPDRLASVNSISAPYTLRVGQRLRIPGVRTAVSPAPSFEPQHITATASPPAASQSYAARGTHRVSEGETLFAIGRTYNVHPYKIAEHNNLAKPYSLTVGQQIRIPGTASRNVSRSTSEPFTGNTYVASQPTQAVNTTTKSSSGSQVLSQPVESVERPIAKAQDSLIEEGGQFRWPVRGRLISKFGSKPGGTRNEGINISVPEGTSIRASEAGVVAYAGNELKGYGNLVLVRHEGGWVSAYAHNSELLVKRGDTVRRGEIIAKSGQTGSVTSPQLHFELRKGASAVNPLKHMSTSTASN